MTLRPQQLEKISTATRPRNALAAIAMMLLIPLSFQGQSTDSGQGESANGNPTRGSLPLGTLTLGYAYNWADQGGYHRSTNGWLAKPALNLTPHWSIYLDASNYYGANIKGRLNAHTYTLGVSHAFTASSRLTPALFVQSGDSRTSNAGSIVNGFAFLTGLNVTTPLNQHVSLSINPIEYVYVYANGESHNSYSPKFSLSFPLGRHSHRL